MLTAVRFFNRRGDMLELPLDAFAGGSQYVIKKIDGLGPPKADILTSEYVGVDGGVYQSAKGAMRNVVMQLGFNPLYNVEDPIGELRRSLYLWFMPKIVLEMHFISSNFETVKLFGRVETNEPSLFSKEPEVQISIVCPDPYFYGMAVLEVTGVRNQPLVIENPGTVESGLIFTIENISSDGYVSLERAELSLEDDADSSIMAFVGSLYYQGDPMVIQFNTIRGQKAVGLQFMEYYTPTSDWGNRLGYANGWTYVVPGTNTFTPNIDAMAFGTCNTSIKYTPKYGGL